MKIDLISCQKNIENLMRVYDSLVLCKRLKYMAPNVDWMDTTEFTVRYINTDMYLISVSGESVGVFWLEHRTLQAFQIHFCMFKSDHDKVTIGRSVIDKILSSIKRPGVIYGVFPEKYFKVKRFAERLGLELFGEIPQYIENEKGKTEKALIYGRRG